MHEKHKHARVWTHGTCAQETGKGLHAQHTRQHNTHACTDMILAHLLFFTRKASMLCCPAAAALLGFLSDPVLGVAGVGRLFRLAGAFASGVFPKACLPPIPLPCAESDPPASAPQEFHDQPTDPCMTSTSYSSRTALKLGRKYLAIPLIFVWALWRTGQVPALSTHPTWKHALQSHDMRLIRSIVQYK